MYKHLELKNVFQVADGAKRHVLFVWDKFHVGHLIIIYVYRHLRM